MITMHTSELAKIVGGRMLGADSAFRGVGTDSRHVDAGQLFVTLHGPNFDAHDYIDNAMRFGSSAVLCERETHALRGGFPAVVVDDALAALGVLGVNWRQRFEADTVAVTGSNGKTTVKEMLASILADDAPVLATRGNLNNNIGVPLTLLRLADVHRRMVVELGANHRGEIAMLSAMAKPRVGVITCIAPAHLEGFGSIQAVAQAKGELISALPLDGVAVVNADDDYMPLWHELAGQRDLISFGFSEHADVQVRYQASSQGALITLRVDGSELLVQLQLHGRHNALNASAAAAAALAMGVSKQAVQRGLQSTAPVSGRLQMRHNATGQRVLDDTYNANPDSLGAALQVLGELESPRWLVLGDMVELGSNAPEFHRQAGELARASGVDALFAVGPLSRLTVDAFGKGARHFDSRTALCKALGKAVPDNATVLVKGSRSMAMESVVHSMLQENAPCC